MVFKIDLWTKIIKSRISFTFKRSVNPLEGEADLQSNTKIVKKSLQTHIFWILYFTYIN